MKKIALMIAAATAIFVAVPASAQTVVIGSGVHRHGGAHHHHGARHHNRAWNSRAQYRRDRGYHRGHNRGVRVGGPAIVIRP